MKKLLNCLLLALSMGAAAVLGFTSCENERPELCLVVTTDFDKVLQAVNSNSISLTEKLARIEEAVKQGVASREAAWQLLIKAIESLEGTVEERLAAIEAAVSSQGTSLETKLRLVEAAINSGVIVTRGPVQNLIVAALESLSGSLDENIAAIEAAVTGQTASLSVKLALVEAAVADGFASLEGARELVSKAIAALSGTAEENLAAIDSAVVGQSTSLSAKLVLIETAVKNGFTADKTQVELLRDALKSLEDSLSGLVDAIREAVSSKTPSLSAKLDLIGLALSEGYSNQDRTLGFVIDAIESLEGTSEEKLAEIKEAINGNTESLEAKLIFIQAAFESGIADPSEATSMLIDAIASISVTVEGIDSSVDEAVDAIAAIVEAINGNVSLVLAAVIEAVNGIEDPGQLIAAIKEAVEKVNLTPPSLVYDYYTFEDALVIPPSTTVEIPYHFVSSKPVGIEVTYFNNGIEGVTVIPDAESPSAKGKLRIVTGEQAKLGLDTSKIVLTLTTSRDTVVTTTRVRSALFKRISSERVDIVWDGGKLDFFYEAPRVPVTVSIPDTASTWCWQVSPGSTPPQGLAVVSVHVEPNNRTKMRRTSVTVSDALYNASSITFYIYQEYDSEPIIFADSGLKQYLLDNPKVNLNGDSEISMAEAAAVPNLYILFGTGATEGRDYRRFNEFQYFTGIDTIPDGGFNSWRSLDSITLPQSITTILTGYGDCRGIFQDCPNLKSIKGKFTKDNTIIYNKQLLRVAPNVVFDGQFIPDGVEIIGSKAGSQISTTELFIPSSVKKIRDKAFDYSKIETVRFAMTTDDPMTGTAYVDSIAETAFNHCFKLKKFIGPMKNGSLRVTRDNLGLCRDTTFYAYAMGADSAFFAIPEYLNVRKIASKAFDMSDESGNSVRTKLKEIGLPTTVNHFRTGAFCNNESIHLWFKSENPPTQVESGSLNYSREFRVRFPAVMDGDAVNASATDERGILFQQALNYSTIAYYEPSQWFAQFEDDFIAFEDSSLKAKLIENGIDLNGDGEISYREARAVTSVEAMLGSSFQNAPFSAFPEFQCFTGIWTLPAGSFNNWTNLTTITLPKNIGTIDIDFADQAGAAAPSTDRTVFWNCPKLSYIKGKFASEDNKALIFRRTGESTSKLVKVCETIPAYSIPEGVDTIARYCFYKSNAKTVQFPKSLKVIGDCAFEHSAIVNVKFPLGDGSSKVNPDVDTCRVTTVYDRTFAHCYSLKNFEGARVNGKLKVCDYDRVLYRDTTVYAYALGSNVTRVVIPDGKNIKRLTDCLFDMSDPNGNPLPVDELRLPEVIALPTGINHIGERTFFNQAKLVQLYFHGSVVPTLCGPQALANVNSDLWVYIPAGASVDDFAKKLNYNQVTTWETWNF